MNESAGERPTWDGPDSEEDLLPDDVLQLLERYPASERHRLRRVWEVAGRARPEAASAETTEAALKAVKQRARSASRRRAPSRRPARDRPEARGAARRRAVRRWGLAAAAVLCVLGGLAGTWLLRPVEIAAPAGQSRAVALPDGSTVELSSGSSLTYYRHFWREGRRVALQGEAFFDVSAGAAPFFVDTFNATMRVLGTAFNVRAWPTDVAPATRVTLVSGRLALSAEPSARSERTVVLSPGETSQVEPGRRVPAQPARADTGSAATWRAGGFAFASQPLGTIADEIERRFDASVRVEPDSLRRRSVTYYRRSVSSAREATEDLCTYLRLTCSRRGDTLRIGPSPR